MEERMKAAQQTKQAWALGGKIVRAPEQAKAILRDAILTNKQHLIPQARSVLAKLSATA
jgi:hypothetical protein